MSPSILIIEDDPTLGKNLLRFLRLQGYEPRYCSSYGDSLNVLRETHFDVVISDLMLPDGSGMDLLEFVAQHSPGSAFLMMTGHASLSTAVNAFRNGVHDYMIKPFSLEELKKKVESIVALKHMDQNSDSKNTKSENGDDDVTQPLLGCSTAMRELVALIKRVAKTPSTVLLSGESGTGKELAANALHMFSSRSEAPFVAVNLGAVPDELVESHLFGHIKGAFTGADQDRQGLFRTAGNGTLFLDEIGELPLPLQSKLLRALEDRQVFPVGSDVPYPISARIVAATNRDLPVMVDEGQFRLDLYYRLNVIAIRMPSLRDRKEDIPELADHFLKRYSERFGRSSAPTLSRQALQQLQDYSWPGNVRELSNLIERAVVLCDTDRIQSFAFDKNEVQVTTSEVDAQITDLSTAVEQFKTQHIVAILEAANYNRELAAKMLGLSPATLYRHLDKLGLKGYRGS